MEGAARRHPPHPRALRVRPTVAVVKGDEVLFGGWLRRAGLGKAAEIDQEHGVPDRVDAKPIGATVVATQADAASSTGPRRPRPPCPASPSPTHGSPSTSRWATSTPTAPGCRRRPVTTWRISATTGTTSSTISGTQPLDPFRTYHYANLGLTAAPRRWRTRQGRTGRGSPVKEIYALAHMDSAGPLRGLPDARELRELRERGRREEVHRYQRMPDAQSPGGASRMSSTSRSGCRSSSATVPPTARRSDPAVLPPPPSRRSCRRLRASRTCAPATTATDSSSAPSRADASP